MNKLLQDDHVYKIHKKQREYYDKEFKGFENYKLENWRKSYLRTIFTYLKIDELVGERYFLDIGVGGSGYTVIEYAKRGYKAVGLDCSFEGVRKAKEFAEREGVKENCLFVTAYAESLPFKANIFTKVCLIAVLEHIPDDRAVIKEIQRVVKPNGYVFVMVPNTYSRMNPIFILLYLIHDRKVGHLRHYSLNQIINYFTNYGFEFIEGFYSGHIIKLFQILITWTGRRISLFDKLWWYCENIDRKMKNISSGVNLNVLFRKK